MFYITSTPWWLKLIFPQGLCWRADASENNVYLTFDDGPHPEITGFVLEQLRIAGAKGTFFCIGENAERFPGTVKMIVEQGHQLGNHTFTHPDGWKTGANDYLEEIKKTQPFVQSHLFRPPYGKITRHQVGLIRQQLPDFKVIMWTGVTGDFDTSKTGKWCAGQAIRFAKPGNIVVFHDSEKAFPRLKEALPAMLEFMEKHGLKGALLPG